MLNERIDLRELRKLVAKIFNESEESVRQTIHDYLAGASEDDVSVLLAIELSKRLHKASEDKQMEKAVKTDLSRAFAEEGRDDDWKLSSLTKGMVAKLWRQPRNAESKTGGDLGLVFIEPLFRFRNDQLDLVRTGRKSGLLIQAKAKRHKKKWGRLRANQVRRLRDSTGYLELLLYEYSDPDNSELQPMLWQVCAGYRIDEVSAWLSVGGFPGTISTEDTISALALGRIGTDDEHLISTRICSKTGPYLQICIDWKDGEDPERAVRSLGIWTSEKVKQAQQVHVFESH